MSRRGSAPRGKKPLGRGKAAYTSSGKSAQESELSPHIFQPMCTCQSITNIPVAMRPGETPVLIPNTMVKTWAADDTILETVWESRWLPDFWGLSSVGRAPALQAGGREFESLSLHSAEKTAGSRTLKTEYREESIKPRRNRKMWKRKSGHIWKYSFEKERHLKKQRKEASLMPR